MTHYRKSGGQRDTWIPPCIALVDAARNARGTMRENAPAEVKQQARVGTSESIKPDEKSLKGKRDDGKMDAVKDLLKEDLDSGEERKEDRGAFLRRATGEGLRIFEGDFIAYGYRTVPWGSAGKNARQVQKELTELGIDAEIIDGDILWNLDGISSYICFVGQGQRALPGWCGTESAGGQRRPPLRVGSN